MSQICYIVVKAVPKLKFSGFNLVYIHSLPSVSGYIGPNYHHKIEFSTGILPVNIFCTKRICCQVHERTCYGSG